MANPQKAKGDKAERECAQHLTDNTKFRVSRRFGAGQSLDSGDLVGIPTVAIQVCDWKDKTAALRVKPPEADQQAINGCLEIGVTAIRMRGGAFRYVLTEDSFYKLVNKIFL